MLRMMRRLLPGVLGLGLFAGIAHAGTGGEPLRAYGPEEKNEQIVSISGTVIKRQAWGPPGFGETPKIDDRWTAWFIKLDYPVAVHLPELDAFNREKTAVEHELQVRGRFEFDGTYRKLLGKHVIARGLLWVAMIGSDIGDANLDTKEIAVASPAACDRLPADH